MHLISCSYEWLFLSKALCIFGRNLQNGIVWVNTRLPSTIRKLPHYASHNNAGPLHNPLCQPSILPNIFRIHHWRYPVACRYSNMIHATDRCYTQSVTATTRHPRNTSNVIEWWGGVRNHRLRTHVKNVTVQKRKQATANNHLPLLIMCSSDIDHTSICSIPSWPKETFVVARLLCLLEFLLFGFAN